MKIAIALMLSMVALLGLAGGGLAAPVAQGGVIFQDGSPLAFAVVFDGETAITNAQVTINNTAMTSDDNGFYFLEMSGYKAGDAVVFTAKDAGGNLIYSSKGDIPAEVIMTNNDTPTIAGAAYTVTWDCGCGAAMFEAGYADMANGPVYGDYIAPEAGSLTVPAGVTYEGDAIFAVSAITGDTHFLNLTNEELQKRSYFLINRSAWIEASLAQ